MELNFCSSSIPRTGDKEEEQAPAEEASSLPALPAAAAYSALPWRQALSSSHGGGAPGGDDDVEMVDLEKEHMFDKVLTPSDVGKLNRLVIPKQHAESYFPRLETAAAKERGLLFRMEDRTGKCWCFRFSYWCSSQSYVMTKGWSRFVKEKCLGAGDTVSFSRGAGGRLFIDWKHRLPQIRQPMPSAASPYYGPQGGGAGEHHRHSQGLYFRNVNADAPARQFLFFDSDNGGMRPPGPVMLPQSLPTHITTVQPETTVTAVPGRPTLSYCPRGALFIPLATPTRLYDHNRQGHDFRNVNSPTASGKRLNMFGLSLDKPRLGDGESSHDPNELSLRTPGWEKPRKVAKCKNPFQIAHKSAYFDFDFDRPSPPIEKPQSTLYEEINAWIALKKQCEGGCHHTCGQKVGPELVGRNDIKQMCMENILSNRNGGTNYTVVCINAGSCHGKTSLLCDLYNDQQLIDAFDKRMWIQMPDKLDMPVLLRKIVESASNAHCSITNPSYLQEMVEEEITDKKIVLFMDDADIQDQQFWNSTFKVLNASARGSVIVMATRSAIPAAHIGIAIHSYSLSPLSEEFNLVLLQQYAALEIDVPSHPDLVMVAKRLISRFGTNPLNLKAIGGLLSHTDTISLQNHMFEENIMPLQLCHDVLPAHLKKCLAFCSLFPEGYIFDRRHIVLLWISNGCVRPVEGCELEHVGAEYFNELLCRSFFQNSPFHNGKDEKFVMHKLIYKVIDSVSRSRYYKSEDLISSVPENIRHLSIASSQIQTVVKLMPLTENLKDLLTFLVVQPDWQQYRTYCPTLNLVGLYDFFLKFTSMETLDLSHTDIEELPGSIVSMRNLQYLCLNDTRIRALPSELCSLSNLLTLKAKNCRFLTELPGDTKKLLKLRHLDVTKDLGYVLLPQGIGQLTELRTLPVFHANADSSRCSISELGYLRSLRGFLCLSGLECVKTSCKAQEINLKHKQHLQDVTLQWHGGDADIDEDDDDEAENVAEQVLGALEPHANLQELAIRGYEGNAFPGWIQSPFSLPSLVSLTLDSCCNCTQFPSIAQLPSLKFLSVRKMYDVQRLSSAVNGATRFPSLELLNLWEIYGMEELFEASEGDCPRLRKICISRCPDLKRLPCIPSVTELVVHCCHQLPDVPELASLSSLKIEGLYGVESFSLTPASLPVLKKLEIRSCKGLSWVYGLEELTTVQRLKITGCPKLVSPRTRGIWRPE